MAQTISGRCLCGACSYRSDSAPLNIRACHCTQCQKATGGPLYARIALPLEAVSMTGPVTWYRSSEAVERGFCSRCGSTLYSRRIDANVVGVTCGTLDDPSLCRPAMQIWVCERQDWLPLGDFEAHERGPDSPLVG